MLILLRSAFLIPWLIGILVLGVVGIPILWFVGYVVFLRRAFNRFDQMKSKVVAYKFTDDHISTRSDLGFVELPWQTVEKLQRFPDVWLLYFGPTNYTYLPVEQLGEDVQSFIVQQAQKHSVKLI